MDTKDSVVLARNPWQTIWPKSKKCGKCKRIKNYKHFHKNNTVKDGLQSHCKECCKKNTTHQYDLKRELFDKIMTVVNKFDDSFDSGNFYYHVEKDGEISHISNNENEFIFSFTLPHIKYVSQETFDNSHMDSRTNEKTKHLGLISNVENTDIDDDMPNYIFDINNIQERVGMSIYGFGPNATSYGQNAYLKNIKEMEVLKCIWDNRKMDSKLIAAICNKCGYTNRNNNKITRDFVNQKIKSMEKNHKVYFPGQEENNEQQITLKQGKELTNEITIA